MQRELKIRREPPTKIFFKRKRLVFGIYNHKKTFYRKLR